MADQGEFLVLVQLVDAGRKARGQDSLEVRDEDVEAAKVIDGMERTHSVDHGTEGHDGISCPTCQTVHHERAMLREKLYSQGQTFPLGVLEGS